MRNKLIAAIEIELTKAQAEELMGNIDVTFHHLERAHILSQHLTLQHVRVHCYMLSLSVRIRDWHEIFGQIKCIIATALFSCIWVPVGNTGRANVSAFLPMAIPDDLRNLLEQSEH